MKTFTLEEANALIPHVAELLDELTSTREKLLRMAPLLRPMLERAGGNGGNRQASEYALLLQRFNAGLSCFQDTGCQLKDLDEGLVDFPSLRHGQLILLCWKRGEERIEYWHALDSGYAGRQPL